jgi:transcriptional regulator with XRE-family HTH domain
MDINERVARQLSELRGRQGYSIEVLAARSGVSRAMISRIERAESSPTATVLNKLAIGLDVNLSALFGPASYAEPRLGLRHPIASRRAQPEWRDPDAGYLRRTLTPTTAAQTLQLHEARLPAGARITFEAVHGNTEIQQQIWMLAGQLDLHIGGQTSYLREGDCMAMHLDSPLSIHNTGKKEARYLLASAPRA